MTTQTTARPPTTQPPTAPQRPPVAPNDLPDFLQPLPDAMLQNPYFLDALTTLRVRYRRDPSVFVDGNTILCYVPGRLNVRLMPDCFIAFDVDPEAIRRRNGYLTWIVGKPPDFVLEIASPSTARHDMTVKKRIYFGMEVPEVWWSDPHGGRYYGRALAGQRLVDGRYVEIDMFVNSDGLLSGWSEQLGLYLCVGPEGRIIFYDPVLGEYLLNPEETADARIEERAARFAAEDSAAVARAAQFAAEDSAAEARAARLAAEDSAAEERAARLAAEDSAAEARAELRALRDELRRRRSEGD